MQNTPDSHAILRVRGLSKQYANGHQALHALDLDIWRGEIFALLGANGAGKTTLISIICGLVNRSSGTVLVDGADNVTDYKRARQKIGLVPQELSADSFETVWNTVSFSRGLFGKAANPALIEQILKDLSLWDKKDSPLITLSGGMKRRVLIAKALSHEPEILFLDEPTAGVDVALRQGMWALVKRLRDQGVTIILTTHYIEEAQEMADRIGFINKGSLQLVETKHNLMRRLGGKTLSLTLAEPLSALPASLGSLGLQTSADGMSLLYPLNNRDQEHDLSSLLAAIGQAGLNITDIHTRERSLEDIYVEFVGAQS
ncbi:ABC transporter ATP-binding protein [Alcaligenes aquatilis]|jgi:ABC-2 type transport system ATP-binding protein|uniref:ABC transporter ATP-binding protein n=2 Tax=Alcaligenes TaxID=507 RepID=A0A3G2HVR0_9BURK|nr:MULTISPECIES: ABC transporter ATP-binding protein [Alcaligenes]ASR89872.1 multidrug ABC transporter ATP-binding protein [Alcaligenes faecalis]AWG34681.1 multidrug ABC transporter ATP-binding protein [Alcaligenes aquatilis]AYN21089.1 ABC transporter ATP-binding protein [Alcaligenes aquatilis]MCH4224438.1 ABC transporter ATP-binding protein [Alcaligenes faecalis]UQN34581.1 ABC transporter ATP-binding protein [Alcaligenes aquatilis]